MYLVLNAPFTAARSWVTASLFLTVIGVPAVTVNLFGTNLKPLMDTDVTGAVLVAAPAAGMPIAPAARVSSRAIVVAASRVAMRGCGCACDISRASRPRPTRLPTGGSGGLDRAVHRVVDVAVVGVGAGLL